MYINTWPVCWSFKFIYLIYRYVNLTEPTDIRTIYYPGHNKEILSDSELVNKAYLVTNGHHIKRIYPKPSWQIVIYGKSKFNVLSIFVTVVHALYIHAYVMIQNWWSLTTTMLGNNCRERFVPRCTKCIFRYAHNVQTRQIAGPVAPLRLTVTSDPDNIELSLPCRSQYRNITTQWLITLV